MSSGILAISSRNIVSPSSVSRGKPVHAVWYRVIVSPLMRVLALASAGYAVIVAGGSSGSMMPCILLIILSDRRPYADIAL